MTRIEKQDELLKGMGYKTISDCIDVNVRLTYFSYADDKEPENEKP